MLQRLFEVWETDQAALLAEFLASQEGIRFMARLAELKREITFGETSECYEVEALVLTPHGIKNYEGLHSKGTAVAYMTEGQKTSIPSSYKDATPLEAVNYFRRYSLYYEPNISIVDWLKGRIP